jgi:hypothetical protein
VPNWSDIGEARMNIIEPVIGFLDAYAFSVFMVGWILALTGGAMHMIGGGFKDGSSKVPVLGNWQALKPGEDGFLQQVIAGWVMKMGLLMIVLGGLIYFL